MLPLLVADRFVLRAPGDVGFALDLASGQTVAIRCSRDLDGGHPRRWARRCAQLLQAVHPHVLPLVDFGDAGGEAFEAFAATAPLGEWQACDRRTARILALVAAFFHARGLSVGLLDRDRLRNLQGRLVIWPDAWTGVPIADVEGRGGDADSVGEAWTRERDRVAAALRRCGVRAAPRRTAVPRLHPVKAPDEPDRDVCGLAGRLHDVLDGGVAGCPRRLDLVVPGGWAPSGLATWIGREVRRRGYVPLSSAALDPGHVILSRDVLRALLDGRHVCVIRTRDDQNAERAALFFASLTVSSPRPHVFVRLLSSSDARRQQASARAPQPAVAETPASYRLVRGSRPTGWGAQDQPGTPGPAPDPETIRCLELVAAAGGAASRGRLATAERMLRHAVGALTRRMDAGAAAGAVMALGHVHLSRGRAADAASCYGQARILLERAARPAEALEAGVFVGLAWTDGGRFEDAEAVLRGMVIAAGSAGYRCALRAAHLGLARCLLWRQRPREALEILVACEPRGTYDESATGGRVGVGQVREACPLPLPVGSEDRAPLGRLDDAVAWDCLFARAAASIDEPRLAVPRGQTARDRAVARGRPLEVAAACTALALAHLAAGDLPAVRRAVAEGIVAARRSHAPLRALRLRIVLAEALRGAGHDTESGRIVTRLSGLDRHHLPAVIRIPIERLLRPSPPVTNRRPPTQPVVDALVEILDACQGTDDESEQLRHALGVVRRRTGAVSVACFGELDGQVLLLVEEGVGRALDGVARRCVESGMAVVPGESASGLEAAVPIRWAGAVAGALYCRWPADVGDHWQAAGGVLKIAAVALSPPVRGALDRRVVAPRRDAEPVPELIGTSGAMCTLRSEIVRMAAAPFNVLIEGESGSGKELVARALHRLGPRRHRRFCALNCAALSDELLETELFGHIRGAFTGAVADRKGLFEEADGGTLLLDEVGELSARAQAKLLRAIQEGEVRRVGENCARAVDVRIVAATNRPMASSVATGHFRRDLLYRLAVVRLTVPPLRERVEDLPLLAAHFWRLATDRVGSRAILAPATLAALARYDWPGNVRELQNVMAGLAVGVGRRGMVGPDRLPPAMACRQVPGSAVPLDEARRTFETRYVKAALARAGGNRCRAAVDLGLTRQGLAKLMARLGVASEPEAASPSACANEGDQRLAPPGRA